MMCSFCNKGNTNPGLVTVHLPLKSGDLLAKKVPAEICDFCGEYYLSDDVTEALFEAKKQAEERNAQLEVLEY